MKEREFIARCRKEIAAHVTLCRYLTKDHDFAKIGPRCIYPVTVVEKTNCITGIFAVLPIVETIEELPYYEMTYFKDVTNRLHLKGYTLRYEKVIDV